LTSRINKEAKVIKTHSIVIYILKSTMCFFTSSGFTVERILSGRVCPLIAPYPFRRLHLIFWTCSPLGSAQGCFRPAPLHFPLSSRSAYML